MTNPINPNDPFNPLVHDTELNRRPRFEEDFPGDPELADGRAGGGRMAMFAVAVVVVLGAVFYGLNSGTNTADGTRTATQSSPAAQDNARAGHPVRPTTSPTPNPRWRPAFVT